MYSFTSRVRYSECDAQGDITLLALINYLQDCTTFHSEALGAGVEFMRTRNRAWFLAAWNIHVLKQPRFEDEIVISTNPYLFKGIYGFRNFSITSPSGEVYVLADSLWFMMDFKLARPARPAPEEIDPYLAAQEPRLEGIPPLERKLDIPEGEPVEAEPVTVLRHHLDTNYHVNNAQYIEIARDAAEWDEGLTRLDAQYKKSAHLGDVIYPFVYKTEQGCTVDLRDAGGDTFAIVQIR